MASGGRASVAAKPSTLPNITVGATYRSRAAVLTGGGGASSLQTTRPALSVSGDLLFLVVMVSGATANTQTISTPSGWTLSDGPLDSANPARSWAFWRIADNTATDLPLISFGTTRFGGLVMYAIQGPNATLPIESTGTPNTVGAATQNINTPVLTSITANALDLYVGLAGNNIVWGAHTQQGGEVTRDQFNGNWIGGLASTEAVAVASTKGPYTYDKGIVTDGHMRGWVIRGT